MSSRHELVFINQKQNRERERLGERELTDQAECLIKRDTDENRQSTGQIPRGTSTG